MKVKKWKYKECEPDEGAVCSCSAWVCLKLPLSPLSTQVDMSCSDSHPHSCHSFFFLPPPIFYPCSSAVNQQNQSIIFLFPHSWPDCSKPETHTRCLIGIQKYVLKPKFTNIYIYSWSSYMGILSGELSVFTRSLKDAFRSYCVTFALSSHLSPLAAHHLWKHLALKGVGGGSSFFSWLFSVRQPQVLSIMS